MTDYLVFIIAASGNISIGNAAIIVSEIGWRIALGILGGIFVLTGLIVYVGERMGIAKSTKVKTFNDIRVFLKYVNERLPKAELQVDDLSWIPAIGKSDDIAPVTDESLIYHDLIKQVARKIAYREVFIFNRRDRDKKAYALLADNARGYSCAYYDQITKPPLLSFMIIDRKEVLLLNADFPCIAFQQPEIVDSFVRYYDDVWQQSTKMKQGRDIYWDAIEAALGKDKTKALKSLHAQT